MISRKNLWSALLSVLAAGQGCISSSESGQGDGSDAAPLACEIDSNGSCVSPSGACCTVEGREYDEVRACWAPSSPLGPDSRLGAAFCVGPLAPNTGCSGPNKAMCFARANDAGSRTLLQVPSGIYGAPAAYAEVACNFGLDAGTCP